MLTRRPSNGLQLQTVQIIDENNPIDEPVPKQTMTGDDVMGVSTITIKETTNITTKTSRLPKFVRRKEKKDSVEQQEKKQQKPPKSPLMSVAHSVKNKLSRLTRGGNAMSSSAGAEFPMSRSLEIGSKTRIPHRQTSDEIPKSKSMEEQRGMNENSGGFFLVPRRSPTTTLVLCSPGGGPRRLPPDEFLEQQKEPQLLSNKQVQFVDEEDNFHKLSPQKELAFCVWTPEIENNLIVKINEEIKEKEGNEKVEEEVKEMSKIEGQSEVEKIIEEQEKKDINVSTSVLKANIAFEEEKQPTSSSQPPIITEPPPEQSKPISSVGETTITTITTTRRSRSPPRVLLTSLRKSPQSFPPLGNSSLDSQQNLTEKNGRQTKSTVSVSFGEVDVKKYNENKEEIKGKEELTKQKGEEKSGKRKVFSTRSLRMVANRVCEASPLLRRRGHSANAPQERQKEAGMESSTTRFGNNKNSFDSNQQKLKTAKSTFATTNVIRSVNSVRTINRPYGAPLAESESSIVANSPAVEQFPGVFPGKEVINKKRGVGGIFGTNSRFGRKEDKKIIVNEEDKKKQQQKQQQKNSSNITNGSGKANNLAKNVTETKTLNSTSIKSKSSTSFQRPTLVARLSHKKSSSQAVGTSGGGIKKGDDSNKKGSKEAQNQKEEIIKQKQSTMLVTTTTAPLGADFRLIDEPASSVHSHSTPLKTTLDNIQNGRKTSSLSSSSLQSSTMLLIAEQQSSTGEVSLKMLERKMNETNLGNNSSTARSRKRLSSDSKLNDNNNLAATSTKTTKAFPISTTELTDLKSGPREEQMPLVDDFAKSEDGISFTPSIAATSALVVDFRSDLYKLRDSVKKVIKINFKSCGTCLNQKNI
uniref:Uncharacterized protein n=1 Tax=Meloidogyne enterolobii TaxID=390850 RepID=A0A6V7VKF2_MELEN|nr:unnamed protein product [Meloidogyne enterolobii]